MQVEKFNIKNITHKHNNISFCVLCLNDLMTEQYQKAHTKDYFCVFFMDQGKIDLSIEDKKYEITPNIICVTFPDQIQSLDNISKDAKGRILLFEEVLFCSDILKNELRSYNIGLSTKLNCVHISNDEYDTNRKILESIEILYANMTSIKKEQARFYIKILLLGLIEKAHTYPAESSKKTAENELYARFTTLLESHYKTERTVAFYARKLFVPSKKLNIIAKKISGYTAIDTIHTRILGEIKRLLLLSKYSHKEIAFELGFSSPSALNKFVKSKLKETPSELQKHLEQMYNR